MNFFKKKPTVVEDYCSHLLMDINQTQRDLSIAYEHFENVVDPDLIDCYIFQVNSVQKRYKFLLARAKEIGLEV